VGVYVCLFVCLWFVVSEQISAVYDHSDDDT
jgi:hypothetical protein